MESIYFRIQIWQKKVFKHSFYKSCLVCIECAATQKRPNCTVYTFRLFNLFSEIFCLLIVSGYGYGYTSRENWISQQQNDDKHRVVTIKLFVRPILKYFVNICHITIKMFALRLEQNSTIFEALLNSVSIYLEIIKEKNYNFSLVVCMCLSASSPLF